MTNRRVWTVEQIAALARASAAEEKKKEVEENGEADEEKKKSKKKKERKPVDAEAEGGVREGVVQAALKFLYFHAFFDFSSKKERVVQDVMVLFLLTALALHLISH